MTREAKTIHTNSKWQAPPIYSFTSVMEPNSIHGTNKKDRDKNQNSGNHTTSCKRDCYQIKSSSKILNIYGKWQFQPER